MTDITLHLEYFAILREQRGTAREDVSTAASTPSALYEELRAAHGFSLDASAMKVAVNGDFAPFDSPLKDGDTVVFIPPVAGG